LKQQAMCPTPTGHDGKDNASPSAMERHSPGLGVLTNAQEPGGQLNAQFVEYLMGYPKNWTDLDIDKIQREREADPWSEEWPGVPRVANGVKERVNRLKCLGNSIVPQIAELIFQQLAFDDWRQE